MKWIQTYIYIPACIFLFVTKCTETKTLQAGDCKTEQALEALKGTFEVFTLDYRYNEKTTDDENDSEEFKCYIPINNECKELLESKNFTQGAQLSVNGTVQIEGSEVSSEFVDDQKIFNIALNYESHLNAKLTCMYIFKNVTYTSEELNIGDIDEYHNLTLISSARQITAGESYTLNCSTENERGLNMISWNVKIDDVKDKYWVCKIEEGCSEETTEDPFSSIITIETSKDLETRKQFSYECSTRALSFHKKHTSVLVKITVSPVNKSWIIIISVAFPVLVFLCVVSIVTLAVRRRKLRSAVAVSVRMVDARSQRGILMSSRTSNPYEGMPREDDALLTVVETVHAIMDRISQKHSSWEKDKRSLLIKEQIGVGNFGFVFSGKMPDEHGFIQTVAIKTIKEQGLEAAALLEFEKEMEMMTTLRHKYIVNLLGICTTSLPFYIIMELLEHGQLNTYLNGFAPTKEKPLGGLSVSQLAWMCQQPCDALEYLSSKHLVHRDVSARNCLVGENLLVKLADFGLSRDTSDNAKNYYKKEGGMVPVKWMAPEALTYGKYTTSNDVWGFGVLCWEAFSFGAEPFAHLSNQQVMVNVNRGERMERPLLCPEPLWDILEKCWVDAPDDRIMFSALLAFFKEYSEECSETLLSFTQTQR